MGDKRYEIYSIQEHPANAAPADGADSIDGGEPQSRERSFTSQLQDVVGTTRPEPKELSFLSDVTLSVCAELGRTTITIRKLLSLAPGSILELHDTPSAQVHLRANGKAVASGEIITVNDRFGVRVTSIIAEEK